MNASGDAAEQMVRMSLQSVEVAGKLSMDGAERLVKLILYALKDTKRTKGRASLNTMLKSRQPIKVFEIKDKELKKFCQEAKKYGVMYHVLKDRDKNDGKCDIMVRADDSSKVNRIFQRFNLGVNNKATIRADIEKSKQDKEKQYPSKSAEDKFLDELFKKPQQVEKGYIEQRSRPRQCLSSLLLPLPRRRPLQPPSPLLLALPSRWLRPRRALSRLLPPRFPSLRLRLILPRRNSPRITPPKPG